MSYTTIQISRETRGRLARLKETEGETYDELLNALLELVPSGDDEGEYTDEFKASLLRALADVKRGRTRTLREIREELGIR
ncbi:MAG: hypothetical protein HYS81_05265 [Candidatus Aenigmatarchaeota archaeon]|nr:MAG: hypothetical protein HYS81_05265 [Candidatus Aenigmarchaeota archaeon]